MTLPKYQLIKNNLKQQITSGAFENGDKFYTESELTELFKVSSITVIRALNDLEKEGFLVREQGRGTFVSRARKEKLVHFSDIELFPIRNDCVEVLSIKHGNQSQFLEKLNLPSNASYYCIERIRKNKTHPIFIMKRTYRNNT